MNRTFLILAASLICFTSHHLLSQTNLLDNPGFETWSAGAPEHWERESGCAAAQETAIVYNGGSSVRLEKTGTSNRGLYQDVPVGPGIPVSFHARILNSSANATVRLTLAWYSGGTYLYQYSQSAASAGQDVWQRLEINEVTVPETADMARCRIRVYGEVDLPCYADDAHVFSESSLAVELSDFNAVVADGGIRIRWRTESETGTAGFHIFMSGHRNGPFEQANTALIPGQGNRSFGTVYEYFVPHCGSDTVRIQLREVTIMGEWRILETVSVFPEPDITVPGRTGLVLNFPNPFNPETVILYAVCEADAGIIDIDVLNSLGQRVVSLMHRHRNPGSYRVTWNGKDHDRRSVPAGIYYCRIRSAEGVMDVRRMVKVQ
ncbi:T9SS type A sorting domain-containing protein [bacterium]|nr:T9SS type A sorting domain-containing protein [bacterium]